MLAVIELCLTPKGDPKITRTGCPDAAPTAGTRRDVQKNAALAILRNAAQSKVIPLRFRL